MAAAEDKAAKSERKYCQREPLARKVLAPGISPNRERAIWSRRYQWANGTVLKFYFFEENNPGVDFDENGQQVWQDYSGPKAQMDAVRKAFQEWKDVGIGLEFQEVTSREEAEIRIGFLQGDGSWSLLGSWEHLEFPDRSPHFRTMNFGWSLTSEYGYDTALHEIGHAIGLVHSHKHPKSPLVWNETEVFKKFRAQGWSDKAIRSNILERESFANVEGSAWDVNSIMHYWFEPKLVDAPEPYASNGIFPENGLSPDDKAWIKVLYPALGPSDYREISANRSEMLEVLSGGQANFVFEPELSRNYNCQVFGESDCIVTVFEELQDGSIEYRGGDDDSGEDRNALVSLRLLRGHRYIIRVMLNFDSSGGMASLMVY